MTRRRRLAKGTVRWGAALLPAVLVLAPASAAAGSADLPAARDNTLIEDAAGARSSGSGPAVFVGRNSGGKLRRGVMAFDVPGAVPEGSVVTAVTLILYADNVSDTTRFEISLHRVLDGWGEGASVATGGSGAPSEPGDATWLHRFYPDSLWNAPGGDFETAVSAAVPVGDVGTYSWSGAGMVADVQDWVDHPERAFGWLMTGDEAVNGSAKRFVSRESTDSKNRPVLIVTFTPPGTPVRSATWGRIKARYGGPGSER